MTAAVDTSLPGRMVRAARLDPELYEEVERDTGAIGQAATVVVIAAIASGIGVLIGGSVTSAVVSVIGTVVGWALWAAITYWIGKSIFGTEQTQVTMGEMLRTLGFSYTPGIFRVLGFIPILGTLVVLVVGLWQLVAGVIAVRQALDFSTGRAIGTVIVGWIVQFAIAFVIALFFV